MKNRPNLSFVESHQSFLLTVLVFLGLLMASCTRIETEEPTDFYTIQEISKIPDPKSVGYPHLISVIAVKKGDEEILIAVQASKDRQILPEFAVLKVGQKITGALISWDQRPPIAHASRVLNNMADDFDKSLFYSSKLLPVGR